MDPIFIPDEGDELSWEQEEEEEDVPPEWIPEFCKHPLYLSYLYIDNPLGIPHGTFS